MLMFMLPGIDPISAASPLEHAQKTRELPEMRQVARKEGPAVNGYAEVFDHIRRRAFFPPPSKDLREMTASSLRSYITEKDPYSDLLSPKEYDRFKSASNRFQAGIGLDIQKRRNGDMVCYPTPGGPADAAGIKPGERLLSLDGVPTVGKSLPAIVALASGAAGTEVAVEVATLSGQHRRVVVTRSPIPRSGVSEYTFRSARIIKLSNFTPSTRQELGYLISNWHKSKPIIIDLRGCGGGDFYAAIDSAMLFLAKGEPIITVKERSGIRSYVSTIGREPPVQRVFLWQDGLTASAAEIFIAALSENVRGTTVGMTSAGKGTRQDVIELLNGGALILTTGYLITPHGLQFDGQGLVPMYSIQGNTNDTAAFFSKIAALID